MSRPAWLPAVAVVLGLARSGNAAADALERRGVAVRRVDAKLGPDDDPALLDGAGLLVLGTGTGRGTYLCPRETCVEQALRKSSIPRRLCATVEIPSGLAASVIAALPGGRNPHG